MPRIDLHLDCPIHDSARVRQVAEIFDLPLSNKTAEQFSVDIPSPSESWRIGAIVGPSGSGKTTIARSAFGESFIEHRTWPARRAVIDGFGPLPISSITRALTAVGFSSPPAWLKPYSVLSNGERFRCDLARALLSGIELVVFDEFTSLVDRTVARISSAAVARAIRGESGLGVQGSAKEGPTQPRADAASSELPGGLSAAHMIPSSKNPELRALARRFVAVTCHYDILPWLEPDWVVDMATRTLTWGRRSRPAIRLQVAPCARAAWDQFSRHHYLSGKLNASARCYLGTIEGRPAAFTAVLPFPHPIRPGWREHRTVCLPDYQGIGIGSAMSEFVASLYRATGKPYFSTTSHPAMIAHRSHSPLWRITRKPSRVHPGGATSTAPFMKRSVSTNRITAGFEYVGPGRTTEANTLELMQQPPQG